MLVFEWNFLGLSTEVMPSTGDKVIDGSTYYECDTGDFYIYYKGTWYKQTFVTEAGINVFLYKYLIHRMFGKAFDTNIMKANVIKPPMGSSVTVTTDLPSSITSLELYGDTFQQTYTGKNLWSFDTGTFTNNSGSSQSQTHTDTTLTLTATGTTGAQFITWITPELDSTKTYTISGKAKKIVKGTDGQPYIRVAYSYSDDGSTWSSSSNAYNNTSVTQGEEYSFSYTLPSDHKYYRLRCYNNAGTPVTIGENTTYYDLQLEANTIASAFEPYVGGIPAPNPDYPQDVKVVTNNQMVTINEDEAIVIPLDSVELCKIGTNQDYIYKNGDDWYIHKLIGKKSITNIDSIYNLAGTGYIGSQIQVTEMKSNSRISGYCNRLTPFNSPSGATSEGITFGAGNKYIYIVLKESRMESSTKANWDAWFSNNETVVYYPLSTPTDTKITDTNLITKLNLLVGYELPIGTNTIVVTATDMAALLKLSITERD